MSLYYTPCQLATRPKVKSNMTVRRERAQRQQHVLAWDT